MNQLKRALWVACVGVLFSCSMEKQSRLNYPLSAKGDTIDAYFGRSDAKIYQKAVTVVGIVDKDGNVTY